MFRVSIGLVFSAWMVLMGSVSTSFAVEAGETKPAMRVDWASWESLPVVQGGRRMPFAAAALEFLRTVQRHDSIADPKSGVSLAPTEAALRMIFDWQGWDHPKRDQMLAVSDWRSHYFHFHQSDEWDRAVQMPVQYPSLRTLLRLPAGQEHVTPAQLLQVKVFAPDEQRELPFSGWTDHLADRQVAGVELGRLELEALELATRWRTYQMHRMGRGFVLLPPAVAPQPDRAAASDPQNWLTLAEIWLTDWTQEKDPTGRIQLVQRNLLGSRTALRDGHPGAFQEASRKLVESAGEQSAASGFPTPPQIGWERLYLFGRPFQIAGYSMLVAAFFLLLEKLLAVNSRSSRWSRWAGGGSYALSVAMMLAGLVLRVAISGRAPVANPHEWVLGVGVGVAALGAWLERWHRRRDVLAVAAVMTTLLLLVAESRPLVLLSDLRPLESHLGSPLWYSAQRLTTTLSCAALTLALGMAGSALVSFWLRREKEERLEDLRWLTYRATQLGVALLAAGIFLRAIWADRRGGPVWDFPPQEVWAVLVLLGYLAFLYVRSARWHGGESVKVEG